MRHYIIDETTLLRLLKIEDSMYGGMVNSAESRLLLFPLYEDKKPKCQEFRNAITATELLALKSIINTIGYEGNFSIVKLIQSSGISRPVFTSINQKLKEYQMAEVENQGVKGTHIKFLVHPVEILGEDNEEDN